MAGQYKHINCRGCTQKVYDCTQNVDKGDMGRLGPFEENTIICGDAREVLAQMPEESVHCVITSPPYWGLRSYEGTECIFGGDEGCEHEWTFTPEKEGHAGKKRWQHIAGDTVGKVRDASPESWKMYRQGAFCSLCGCWRGQYGLEPTPEIYVEHTLEFLRAIWRVLRKDGVVWWNIGDSYVGGNYRGGGPETASAKQRSNVGTVGFMAGKANIPPGLKPKDLVMIPFRVALAAQADGWWVRQVVIWEKPNPMPESIDDRCTVSHEYVWMFTKSGKPQYWTHRDLDGTRKHPKPDYRWANIMAQEEVKEQPPNWKEKVICPKCQGKKVVTHTEVVMGAEMSWEADCDLCVDGKGRPTGKVHLWKRINPWRGHDYYYDADAIREPGQFDISGIRGYREGNMDNAFKPQEWQGPQQTAGRNKRSVWTIPTSPYSGPHYSTFPPDLVEPMILAGTSPKVCTGCGAPWERVVEKGGLIFGDGHTRLANRQRIDETGRDAWAGAGQRGERMIPGAYLDSKTLGWRPTCPCNGGVARSVVLDPFCGTATVAQKCIEHHRDYIMIDIDPKSIELAKERVAAVQPRLVL